MADPRTCVQPGDALIVVDVQIDFCPGGALPIPEGHAVIPVLNRWIAASARAAIPVYYSYDWHPPGHVSFRESGGQWPPHCVQHTDGARFHPNLQRPAAALVVAKGVRLDRDQYSAFDETGLAADLRTRGVTRLWIGGLAQDVCVRATVLDARREGFEAIVIADGTRPVSLRGGQSADEDMRKAGARFETTDEWS
jgi:nicotinamidase/pyrazinamidase